MLRAFDPFSSRADHLDCPHSHSLGTDEQMGLLAVWQSLRYQCCPHGGHLALVHAMVFHSGRLGWHSPHWYTWADSYMPWVGSAPPCGDQVPTWGQGPCTITWWREVTLMASLGAGVALVSPVGVWHASMARGDAPSCWDRLRSLDFVPAVQRCLLPCGSGGLACTLCLAGLAFRVHPSALRCDVLMLLRQGAT